MNMSLSESINPKISVGTLGDYREPEFSTYYVWIEIYEINGLSDFGKHI